MRALRSTPRPYRVVLVRHGPAEPRDPARWPDDRDRPLSRSGLRETRRAARGLATLVGPVGRLASGTAERTRRTADLLAAALPRNARRAIWDELESGRPAPPILERIGRTARSSSALLLVGHDPALSELLGLALAGEGIPFARLAKAGAACIEFPRDVRAGAGRLAWLLTRAQLTAVGS